MNRATHWLTGLAALLVAIIAILAFAVSFAALRDLAIRSGIPAAISWAWPAIVDGSIVTAMLVIFAWRGRDRRATAWPWTALGFFAAVSIIGNGLHTAAVHDDAQGIAMGVAICVGAIPPIALLLSSEMLVRLLTPRGRDEAAEPAVDVATDDAQPASTGDHEADAVADLATAAIATIATGETTEGSGNITGDAIADHVATGDVAAAPFVAAGNDDLAADSDEIAAGDDDLATGDEIEEPTGELAVIDTVDTTPSVHLRPVRTSTEAPSTPAEQVDWVIERAQSGHEVTWGDVAERLGLSDRQAQRRLTEARKRAPEAFGVAS